ncbi:25S rRNA (cytosine-C(5))-methyltransferase NSUN5 isoform X1 [Beta vulgaris subsp. vulgaris]|uniref:25S rRNA (cytosine-C(5))-methyltransferase NSUN5 isoform X1 n=2 Tax=Beta vulgaris subsp. vulgaris TaxID=3555 RepID=UPI002036CEDF|nr:25S rRNA (cytosine-C(5))-methyltransferase NSUN5 isoform X1 [Beta vulgaris subsp. vulgaris]
MVRRKAKNPILKPSNTEKKKPQAAASTKDRRLSNAERSAYFGRREAAKVLRTVLQGDARRRAVGSIKSLIFSPSIRNKKGTFALVCQTLKYLPLIKDVLDTSDALNSKWKRQQELMYTVTYDLLFGKDFSSHGTAEKYLFLRKAALESALAKILVKHKVKQVEDLLAQYETPDVQKPRYVRVNTLKMDVDSAVTELGKHYTVERDDLVPDLLILPPGVDLHDHSLVTSGNVLLQGKASSMVAVALGPRPGWQVLDACSAPGNKTVHLAALMKGKGKIVACELNKDRVKLLQNTIQVAGANNVEVQHGDFLKINPDNPAYSELRAILLDPSCSGSGTAADRLDHLLPSHMNNQTGHSDVMRLTKLATFQKKALEHALSFSSVERIVYSTCSIHQIENEDVIKSVLPMALENGFELATPFPQWPRRGLPVFEGSEHLLRMDPVEDKEGFFIALFVRKSENKEHLHPCKAECCSHQSRTLRTFPCTRLSKILLLSLMASR